MSSARPLMETADDLLTPGEVARLFRVDPKTVTRWEKDGRLSAVKTLGGHRRYRKGQVAAFLDTASGRREVIETLAEARALATEMGAEADAARIGDLITRLGADG